MKAIIKILGLALLVVLLEGCTSGKRAFENGDYYQSVLKAVDRLRKNPKHKKSRETLKYAYPAAIDYLTGEINNLKASARPFKWAGVVSAYEQINNMSDQIRRSPGALSVIRNPDRYASQLTEARTKAAEEHYAEGIRILNPNNRQASKEAFYLFQKALGFVNGYKDSQQKMNEAREYATLKVVLEQIPVPGRYSLSANFFQDKVEEFLRGGGIYRNEFLQFFTPREAERVKLDPDHILSIYFEDFVVGQVFKKETTRELTRDSVKVGEVVVDGETYPSYGTVKADYTVHRAEVVSEGLLAMRVIDARNNGVLMSEKLPGTFVWFDEWASFNGDERALTNDEIALTKKRYIPPPPPQDMFIEFTRPIYNQLTNRLNTFYRRF
ncbi:MAG: hypothetical protein AAFQ94_11515 [Bacteroidota bacterium]